MEGNILVLQFIFSITLIGVALIPFIFIFSMVFIESGMVLGLTFGLACIIFFWHLGARLFLSLIWARRIVGHPWLDSVIGSVRCRTAIGKLEVYSSDLISGKIVVLDSWGGGKTIVLGSRAFGHMSKSEVEALMFHLCLSLRGRRWRILTFTSSIFLPAYIVASGLETVVRKEQYRIFIRFLMTPLSLIKKTFVKWAEITCPKQAGLEIMAYDLRSCRAKMAQLSEEGLSPILDDLVAPLVWGEPEKFSLFTPFVAFGNNPKRQS
jgi:hypothetical protein